MAFLAELGGFGVEIICPRVEVDYLREVSAGDLAVAVCVVTVGGSSFRLRLAVEQHGRQVARSDVVLVAFDYSTGASVVLTERQRAALQRHMS